MRLFYTDQFTLPLPDDHRFPMAKYALLRERVAAAPWGRTCEFLIPAAATDAELAMVHTEEYIRAAVTGSLTEREQRRIGFPWSPELIERSRRSTGATIAAAFAAMRDGLSANLAGGTHHAFADRGEGYCVFNDVAVAARRLQADPEANVRQVLVVDCDVHQGNGTAAIFADDTSVTTFSMHGRRNYPLRKPKSDLDVALDSGTPDDVYLASLAEHLPQLLRTRPDLVFYVAGADPFVGDQLGRLALTKNGLRQRDEFVLGRCREQGIPVAICMAGGYAEQVEDIVDIHTATIHTALSFFSASTGA